LLLKDRIKKSERRLITRHLLRDNKNAESVGEANASSPSLDGNHGVSSFQEAKSLTLSEGSVDSIVNIVLPFVLGRLGLKR